MAFFAFSSVAPHAFLATARAAAIASTTGTSDFFTYEGYLTDATTDLPVTASLASVQFRVYAASSGSECLLYSEEHGGVSVQKGQFSVKVGGGSPLNPGFSLKDLLRISGSCGFSPGARVSHLLKVSIDGADFGQVSLTAAPLAWVADSAETVTGLVEIAHGGTGATSATQARLNLGLGSVASVNLPAGGTGATFLNDKGEWVTASGGFSGDYGDLTNKPVLGSMAAQDAGAFIPFTLKGSVDGVASLNGTGRVPLQQLGEGTADNSTYLRGDGSWASVTDLSPWTISGAGKIHYSSGSVGIGTTSPGVNLEIHGASGATLRIVDGQQGAGKVLTSDVLGTASWASLPTGGLAYFTENKNELPPNDSIPAVSFAVADTLGNNVDLVLSPKGVGALSAQVATDGAEGGGKRGQYAVDWQRDRENSPQVASGTYAVLSGGARNTASGIASTVSGGQKNKAVANDATVGGGTENVAQNSSSVVSGGYQNIANGVASVIGGGHGNRAIDQNATVSGGQNNKALGYGATVGGGYENTAGGSYSFAVNLFTNSASYAQSTFGRYNAPVGSETPDSWIETDPLFVIGNGLNASARSNALVVLKNGFIGLGTNTPDAKLNVNGDVHLSGGLIINSTSICTSAGCVSPSDASLKENVRPLHGSLEKILKLQGVEYDYKDRERFPSGPQVGVIAQDVEKVFPEVVARDPATGLRAVAYSHLVAPLIEAVKSLYERLSAVEREIASTRSEADAKIEKLERENREMKARLEQIEKRLK